MRPAPRLFLALFALLATPLLADQTPGKPAPPPASSKQPISIETRMTLVRTLNAEFVFARKPFPMGDKGLTIRNGQVSPSDATLVGLVANNGATARTGEKAQITNIEFRDNKIIFEINGGPKKKQKWYQRIRIAATGGETPIAPQANPNAKGSMVTVVFDKYVPDLTVDEVKQLLAPVLAFGAGKSATDVYMDSLPPKVREAIKNHEPLVGMKKEMVIETKGRPYQKIRERDGDIEYEEWLYGMPPADVYFVRFVGDECTQIKVMKGDGTKIVRTEREMPADPTAMAQGPLTPAPAAPSRPSLRRPGEDPAQNQDTIRPPSPVGVTPTDPNNTPLPTPGEPGPNAPQPPPTPR